MVNTTQPYNAKDVTIKVIDSKQKEIPVFVKRFEVEDDRINMEIYMQQPMETWNPTNEYGELTLIIELNQKEVKRYAVRIIEAQPIIEAQDFVHLRVIFQRMKPIQVHNYIEDIKLIVRTNWDNRVELLLGLQQYYESYNRERGFIIDGESG